MSDNTRQTYSVKQEQQRLANEDSVVSKDRRRLVRALTAGGVVAGAALPEKWSTPVVDSVMLPAHAQTTSMGFFGQGDLNNFFVMLPASARDALKRLAGIHERRSPLDALVGVAHAEIGPPSEEEISEASSSSFGFVSGYLSPERRLTLRMDIKLYAGSENPLGITCVDDIVVPLCVERKINKDDFRSLSLINCDEFEPLDGFIEAKIKSMSDDHALIALRPASNGGSDTLYLMRGGNRPNCPDCGVAGSESEEDCTAPWLNSE